ncbi:MAG: laccase domain-containing protein, partial [Pseudomonadota bacterium]
GWRSLSAGIVTQAVERLSAPRASLMAWLAPAIAQPAFEVGDDVRDVFLAGVPNASGCFEPNRRGRWQADLYGLARLYLADAGIESVHGGGYCTYDDAARFFSYRRDGTTGRMASFICWRQDTL